MHNVSTESSNLTLSSIDSAIVAMREGRLVIIVDDENRENEGDFVVAAEHMTPAIMNQLITEARGLVCCAMHGASIDRLDIPMMVPDQRNGSGFGTGFTISVEAAEGVTTGISAADRSHTVRTLANPNSTAAQLVSPGHIFPLRAKDGGVLERRGQTEASVDLAILAGLEPAAVICEIMRDNGEMMRLPELLIYGKENDIPVISVEALVHYRKSTEQNTSVNATATPKVRRVSNSSIPTPHGTFDITVYRDAYGLEHSILSMGNLANTTPLVRLHSECLTGDVFGSKRCDCGDQLDQSLADIAKTGHGALLYLRQEGRGIGLGNKIKAYELQDNGFDTVDANLELGFPADARQYDVAADMLREVGVSAVQLMTNNPAKIQALSELGITVTKRIPLVITALQTNEHYLRTKADRMGHQKKNDRWQLKSKVT